MPPLELRWDPARRYRAFVHRPVGVATIVSSKLVDEARVLHVGGVMLIADRDGFVCDLEIELGAEPAAEAYEPAERTERLVEPVTTVIETAVARPSIDVTAEWLMLRFGGCQEGRWHQLGGEPLYLRLATDGSLLALAAGASDDPDGSIESQWLDEIEGRPGQEQGTRVSA